MMKLIRVVAMVFLLVFELVSFARAPRVEGNRLPSKPFISGDGFRAMADHIYDETDKSLSADEIAYADIVFVKSDYLNDFLQKIHPYIINTYILISHNSDSPAPGKFVDLLYDPKILRWYGQNPTIAFHEKFVPIPIGVGNRYTSHGADVRHFIEAFNYQQKVLKRSCIVGLNFHVGNNVDARKFVFDYFSDKSFVKRIFSGDHFGYMNNMAHAKFILSPPGNGLDCHRTWEALIAGSIPILITSDMNELLEDLPVLIVDKWQDVNIDMLEKAYDEFQQKKEHYKLGKIYFDFWHDLLKKEQLRFRKQKGGGNEDLL